MKQVLARAHSSWRDLSRIWIRWCRCKVIVRGTRSLGIMLSIFCSQRRVRGRSVQVMRSKISWGSPLVRWVRGHMDKLRQWIVLTLLIVQGDHNMYSKRTKLLGIVLKWLLIKSKFLFQSLIKGPNQLKSKLCFKNEMKIWKGSLHNLRHALLIKEGSLMSL